MTSRNTLKEQEYYVPLYRIAVSKMDDNIRLEKMSDWLAANALRVSNQLVKRTLRKAGREDLVEYLIQEEDIAMGDTVRSRATGRFGKVIGIHGDGETIDVKWESGGIQPLSKGGVFKIKEKTEAVLDNDNFSIVKTDLPGYDTQKDKDKIPYLKERNEEKKAGFRSSELTDFYTKIGVNCGDCYNYTPSKPGRPFGKCDVDERAMSGESDICDSFEDREEAEEKGYDKKK